MSQSPDQTSQQVRSSFLDYFKTQGHQLVPSSSLVPQDDPTLLFANAGMNQFKNIFLGLQKPSYTRAVSSQKCLRAGGKHNDLENVGFTARHHTFFEMLGNFSFGDYFKKDAIHLAWQYVTQELQLDKNRLYVSVFTDDHEAAEIWHKQEGVAQDRIYRFGEKDNFWRMGETGPCGPCSEIFYDLGPEVEGSPQDNVMGGPGDRYMEIWNLVFMQYFEDGQGSGLKPLPRPSIDTGMGLERISAVVQNEINNYHTDLFQGLIQRAAEGCGLEYVKSIAQMKGASSKERELQHSRNVAFRVLADHGRAAAFLIGDGVLPSNEGRGYVLRRIIRRAVRYGRNLSESDSLLPLVVGEVIAQMGSVYPELEAQGPRILQTVQEEEARFLTTLDQGTAILNGEIDKILGRGHRTLGGQVAFKLYDTYGFPVDLTRLMLKERGLELDETGFEEQMNEAKNKAKASWKGKALSQDAGHLIQLSQQLQAQHGPTTFVGYEKTYLTEVKCLALSDGQSLQAELRQGQSGVMAFAQTPFYAEGGGQVGDSGLIKGPSGQAEVLDCRKENEIYWHWVQVTEGGLKSSEAFVLQVNESERRQTANNHSATHLLHSALREVLGTQVSQAGSLVEPERLRFDFTHNRALTEEELERIEQLVNREIAAARPVSHQVMSPDQAKKEGALALFGEKYGDQVRVIGMGDFSKELCGGTHVPNTSWIRLFKIVSEGGVSSGVRRIEALTGEAAHRYLSHLAEENLKVRKLSGVQENWQAILSRKTEPLLSWAELILQDRRSLERQVQQLKGASVDVESLLKNTQEFDCAGAKANRILAEVELDDRKLLSDLADQLRARLTRGVAIVVGSAESEGKARPLVVAVTKNLSQDLKAGEVIAQLGGKGGGRPDFAQGSVESLKRL